MVVLAAEALDLALEALHCRQKVCLHARLDLHKSVLVLHHLKPQYTQTCTFFIWINMSFHTVVASLPVLHTNNDKNKQLKITQSANKIIKQEK